MAAWFAGEPVDDSIASRRLARRLLDAGAAHPVFVWGSVAAAGGVTVVIPVRDRYAELARCLAGLGDAAVASSTPTSTTPSATSASASISAPSPASTPSVGACGGSGGGYQVIVVDDCSAEPEAILRIAGEAGARVIRREVNGGAGAARNTGLEGVSTEFVAFLDSDCVPGAGWLDGLLPHFADPAVGAVAPRIVAHEAGAGWLGRYEGASSTLDMGVRPSIVRPGARVSYVPGAALVVRREAAGDGFAPGMRVGEDVDFVWRLAGSGWRVRYEPAAVMGHDHRVRFRAWFSRRADYGTSAAALEQLHPGAVRPLYASWWTLGAWAALLSGRPVAGLAIAGTATALLARRLSRVTGESWPLPAPPARPITSRSDNSKKRGRGIAWALAARLAGGGTLAAGRPLGSALSRTWWPLAIPAAAAVPRLRLPVAALMLAPPLLDWAQRRPPLDPVRYAAARLLDDAAYGMGVWQGCLSRRTARPLIPALGSPGRSRS